MNEQISNIFIFLKDIYERSKNKRYHYKLNELIIEILYDGRYSKKSYSEISILLTSIINDLYIIYKSNLIDELINKGNMISYSKRYKERENIILDAIFMIKDISVLRSFFRLLLLNNI
jgi:hypothetical protein